MTATPHLLRHHESIPQLSVAQPRKSKVKAKVRLRGQFVCEGVSGTPQEVKLVEISPGIHDADLEVGDATVTNAVGERAQEDELAHGRCRPYLIQRPY